MPNAATKRKQYAPSCGSDFSLTSGRWSSPPLRAGVEEEPTSAVVASEEVGLPCPKSKCRGGEQHCRGRCCRLWKRTWAHQIVSRSRESLIAASIAKSSRLLCLGFSTAVCRYRKLPRSILSFSHSKTWSGVSWTWKVSGLLSSAVYWKTTLINV